MQHYNDYADPLQRPALVALQCPALRSPGQRCGRVVYGWGSDHARALLAIHLEGITHPLPPDQIEGGWNWSWR